MPELPEVETVRNTLKRQLINKKIIDVKILYKNMIENDIDFFKNTLIGKKIIDIRRRGKYLIFVLDNFLLISHLRMEGKFFIKNKNEQFDKHEHVIICYNDFELRYHDTRKFGRMKIIPIEEECKYLKNLAEDANLYTDDYKLYNIITKKRNPIKTILLDQSIIAGLGNIYVDEVLFKAKINPLTKGIDITMDNVKDILKYSKSILDSAIKYKGTTIRSYTSSLGVYGEYQNYLCVHTKVGNRCKVCDNVIEKITVGGRGTYYCPNCQKN